MEELAHNSCKNRPEFKLQNIIKSFIESFQTIDELNSILEDLASKNIKCIDNECKQKLEINLNKLERDFRFVANRKSVRLVHKKLAKRKKKTKKSRDEYFQLKFDDLLKNEKPVCGERTQHAISNSNQDIQQQNDKLNGDLDHINRNLFDLKQIKEFSSILTKLAKVRLSQCKQTNSSNLIEQLNGLNSIIEQRKCDYEKEKSTIKEALKTNTKLFENRTKAEEKKHFNQVLNQVEDQIRRHLFSSSQIPDEHLYPCEYSLHDLILIRSEWDRFVSDCARGQSIPFEWIEPNQSPSEEWSKFTV